MATEKWFEAGPELDALVAERLMGFDASCFVDDSGGLRDAECNPVPSYSTSIEAAWSVVEELAIHSKVNVHNRIGKWACWIITGVGTPTETQFFEYGETAPLAICRAALKTVGVENA